MMQLEQDQGNLCLKTDSERSIRIPKIQVFQSINKAYPFIDFSAPRRVSSSSSECSGRFILFNASVGKQGDCGALH
jgi:hypothetical protein